MFVKSDVKNLYVDYNIIRMLVIHKSLLSEKSDSDVGPSTYRALILQEPVIYFNQSAEDLAKYGKIAKFFSLDANLCCKGAFTF